MLDLFHLSFVGDKSLYECDQIIDNILLEDDEETPKPKTQKNHPNKNNQTKDPKNYPNKNPKIQNKIILSHQTNNRTYLYNYLLFVIFYFATNESH